MKCKNENCLNDTIGKNIYCSLKCRNNHVNKNLRDYSKCSQTFKNKKFQKIQEYIENPKLCKNCNSIISFEKKRNSYCSLSCSASYNNKNRIVTWNDKIRTGVNKYIENNGYFGSVLTKVNSRKNKIDKHCLTCGKVLLKNKCYCSNNCRNIARRSQMNDFLKYKSDCQFKFNLSDFPNEYDFHLIEKYGWYSPTNKKNNINGVSRDHMFSIKEGYELGIDPKIISHPANCQLLQHSENVSKNKKSSISLSMLLVKINEFNEKYNLTNNGE